LETIRLRRALVHRTDGEGGTSKEVNSRVQKRESGELPTGGSRQRRRGGG